MGKHQDQETLRVLTANDLLTGEVVFLTSQGTWSRDLDQARLAQTSQELASLDAVAASAAIEAATVGAYVIEVGRDPDGGLCPLAPREKIRLLGPLTQPGVEHPDPAQIDAIAERPLAGFATASRSGGGDDHVSL
ncbi:hypothetical protein MNBD_ALPHA09-352 [hydrothermal vent metagenome]|uniref:DUF2849 domain-containing protein n=1 Tax=hydrothermal vent metagenome TaxID=652676 RepID=A0A3B0U0E4_9ZZZZ